MNKLVIPIIVIAVVALGIGAFIVFQGPAFPKPQQELTPGKGTTNTIASIRTVSSAPALENKPGVEIEVTSNKEFPVRNELVVLRIGAQEFILSRYPESGDTHTLIFTLTPEEFAKTATGDPVTVRYGRDDMPGEERWDFGTLDKGLLSEPTESAPTLTPEKAPKKAADIGALKTLAEQHGIRFGAFYQYDLRRGGDNIYDQVFEREMNVMTVGAFWNVIHHGARTDFDFSEIDATVAWARAHGMELQAQSLVWFDSADIPDWLRTAPTSEVESIMNEHIDAVVGRYAGRIKNWNVVNEAVNDDGTLRQNHKWAEAMGDDYIRKAFVRAHAADRTAVLYYNDYDIESNQAKYEGVKALLISLKNQGAPVHALGWQMHIKQNSFDAATLLAHMNEIADLGFDNYITELDVELPMNATAADYEQQKQTYKAIVETFLAARRHKSIVVWGLRDGDPYWLTNDHPLLFDENFHKKPAYFGVQEALLKAKNTR